MASEESIIRNYAKTGIILDELGVPNRSGNTTSPDMNLRDADDKEWGYYHPVVYLNGYSIGRYLVSFEIDVNQILPVVNFKFYTGDPTFLSVNYPKDGDIVSIYIRANTPVYKPLRMDFNILSVDSGPSTTSSGEVILFDIMGECRIPRFYSEVCRAYRNKTSYETLFEVSQELDLGFATNDPNLTDRMTWINPNLSYYNFIKEVTKSCYKDDKSFYGVWIDVYYNLNFVNLNNQLEAENIEQIVSVVPGTAKSKANDALFPGIELAPAEIPLLISNIPTLADYPFYASRFTLLSESGNVTNLMGYIQDVQFYDENVDYQNLPDEKYITYTIEATTTDKIQENMVLQRGRANEKIYLGEVRKRWMGILNSGQTEGVHPNYLQARVQNPLNLSDVTKFTLQVETGSYFAGYVRGQVIPVLIYSKDKGIRMENTGQSNTQQAELNQGIVLDQFLSGQYILMGYSIRWSQERGFYQVLNLSKREWILNSAGNSPKAFPVNVITNNKPQST